MSNHTAICYAQVEPIWTSSGSVRSIKITKITQFVPQIIRGDCVVLRLAIEIPDAAFDALKVAVVVDDLALIRAVRAEVEELSDDQP